MQSRPKLDTRFVVVHIYFAENPHAVNGNRSKSRSLINNIRFRRFGIPRRLAMKYARISFKIYTIYLIIRIIQFQLELYFIFEISLLLWLNNIHIKLGDEKMPSVFSVTLQNSTEIRELLSGAK